MRVRLQAVALGISQQHRLPPGGLRVGLAVANDLDASADFDALCYEGGAAGNLLLRGHVTIRWVCWDGTVSHTRWALTEDVPPLDRTWRRELLATLQGAQETLCLECHAVPCQPEPWAGTSGGGGLASHAGVTEIPTAS